MTMAEHALARTARLHGMYVRTSKHPRQTDAWGGTLALFDRVTGAFLLAGDDPDHLRGWILSRP